MQYVNKTNKTIKIRLFSYMGGEDVDEGSFELEPGKVEITNFPATSIYIEDI